MDSARGTAPRGGARDPGLPDRDRGFFRSRRATCMPAGTMRCSALLLAALAVVTQTRAQGLYSDLYEPGALRLSEVIGMEVVTAQGRSLGRISDLVFDT